MTLPICAKNGPYLTFVEEGTVYAWCTCGLSNSQPFCDGSHKGTGMHSLKHTVEKAGPVYYCGCKQTKTPPFCDGSHAQLAAVNE